MSDEDSRGADDSECLLQVELELPLEKQSSFTDLEVVDEPDIANVSLLIVGRAGAGKTALANGIAHDEVGKESMDLDTEAMEFENYKVKWQQVEIEIRDSPGLQGDSTRNKEEFLAQIKEKADQCDVVIYCMRMDAVRLEKMDKENMQILSRDLGVEFWSKAVVALTYANLVTCPPSHRDDDASKEEWFKKRTIDWQTQLRESLHQANIPKDIADSIPLIPVGYNKATLYFPNPWLIPCDADWRLSFIFALNKKLGNDAMGVLVDELRGNAPIPPPGNDSSCAGLILNLVTGSTQRIKVSTGISSGIGAGVGIAAGMLASPAIAAAGGVAGAVAGGTITYKALTSMAEKRSNSP